MKLKRCAWVLVLLCLALVLILPAQSVGATDDRGDYDDYNPIYTDGIYRYHEINNRVVIFDCEDTVSGHLTIPAELGGDPVTTIDKSAFAGLQNLTSVTIPDSVTTIRDYAFSTCRNLTSVTIPDSVTSIGEDAFYHCDSLASITIPESVTSIGDGAFSCCSSLTSITINNGVIGDEMFSYCSSLTSVTIPSNVKSFGTGSFSYCSGLTSVQIEDGVKVIDWEMFSYCESLTSVTIPDSVTSIGEDAFNGCVNLNSVTIGNNVTRIGRGAFSGCDSLISITIPDSVTRIGRAAFYGCDNLNSVTIGNNVTSIGELAFYLCSSLTYITIPDGVTSIDWSTFGRCSGLNVVALPASITSIGEGAFDNCSNLKRVIFCGTEALWSAIDISKNNTYLTEALRIYHQFTPGTGESCPICSKEDYKEILDIQGVSRAKNLSLKDMIYMKASVAFLDSTGNHAKLTKSEILENGRILFWSEKDLPESSLTVENATAVQTLTDGGVYDDGIQEYYAYSHGVAPAEYGDMIYYRTYIVVDGMEYYGEINEYSVLTYANNQISKTSAKASLKKLLAAMLNYGAAAQVQFQYKADDLVNTGLQSWVEQGKLDASCLAMDWDAGLLTIPDPVDEALMQNFVQKDAQRMTRSLTLQSMVQLKMTFAHKLVDGKGSKLPADGSVSFYYWSSEKYNELYDEERALTKGNVTYVLTGDAIQESYSSKNGYVYYAYFEGIPAKRLGEALYIAAVFTMADGTEYCSGVEIYSPEVYTNNQLAKDTIAENQKTLLKWMVIYGEEAKNYYAD